MDITNIENEWKEMKNNKKRQTDLNNILKDLDSVPEPRAKNASVKEQVKHIVKAILEDPPSPDQVAFKTKNGGTNLNCFI